MTVMQIIMTHLPPGIHGVLIICCLFITVSAFNLSPSERERSIRQNIPGRDYSELSRPSELVEVDVDVLLYMVNELNFRKETLSMTGRVKTKWNDPSLTWYPMQHNNVTFILLPRKRVWSPEIIIDNIAGEVKPIGDRAKEDLIRLEYTGMVHWDVSLTFSTHCDIDITYYPFDTQRCTLELGEWTYTRKEINFTTHSKGIVLDSYKDNGEWNIIGTFAQPKQYGAEYMQLHFGLVMKRKSLYYILNVIVPLVLISILCVISFLIPLDAGERVSYSIAVLLSLAVFLTVVSANMPSTSKYVSVLAVYLVTVMIISALTCVMTILVIRVYHRNDHECPIPLWLQKFVGSFAPLLSGSSSGIIVSQHSSPEHVAETGWSRTNTADDIHERLECWGEEPGARDFANRRRGESRVFQTTRMSMRRKKSLKQDCIRDGDQTRRPNSWKNVARAIDRFCFRLTLFIVLLTNLMMMIVLGAFS
ncbi:neuronal acetylcholine receptor subunit alpha-3-like [Octopus sinensis]|uniref:Neuronal acetylcholine receptor subunit alpha-3-like n=1 Tax=Octopus sinensis TaxID=2607531 RepID=A0A6P7SSI3_9MOLL|nr:neuronal acetylcholine receptor subunit alpha-3-like [Octopus sinensis]XP_036361886.1 neuronal acetylcholine receptor subunit alpha-3-like [Octopus sinensis]XP_036361887.1 neuronal acetylcholine receptor subunit alpha-3-like [Octopus sinensis]XP_036361888.1 neuronal acetylcholine receptor subunit alpha-3-like [Octopus sinensis]XP_036361889.1 neuronal acetylcholine receptor subunit alpha-3-like [Octopus sinensis]